ncbi:MAG: M50 family metallopeptidase [Alphaproteobacteria bacterium]|nr:M50 family metallopeptidase [Alphaproteobacteria bacterium]
MHKIMDYIVNLLKLPAALYLLFSVPALVMVYRYFDFYTFKFLMVGAGFVFFWGTIFLSGYTTRNSMQVISHELTHTFFAYLTLHNAGRIRLNPDGSGGSMQLNGHGNWLISLAPYFFPLFAFFYMLLMPYLLKVSDNNWVVYAILGYFLAYHWLVVLTQVHPRQTDLSQVGFIFSGIVIVGANLFSNGIVLAFASKSWDGVFTFLRLVNKLNLEYVEKIYALIAANF